MYSDSALKYFLVKEQMQFQHRRLHPRQHLSRETPLRQQLRLHGHRVNTCDQQLFCQKLHLFALAAIVAFIDFTTDPSSIVNIDVMHQSIALAYAIRDSSVLYFYATQHQFATVPSIGLVMISVTLTDKLVCGDLRVGIWIDKRLWCSTGST